MILSKRQKRQIAEEVSSFSQVLKSLLNEYKRTKPEDRNEYLQTYTEFRYLQIIGSVHKLAH